MLLHITHPHHEPTDYELEELLTAERTIVTLGRQCDEVYNCIALDSEDLDPFACQFTRDENGRWNIQQGQLRSECPKGLRNRRQRTCSGCSGRCVNIRPGRPLYYWRYPEQEIRLNGLPLGREPHPLHEGDALEIDHDIIIKIIARTSE